MTRISPTLSLGTALLGTSLLVACANTTPVAEDDMTNVAMAEVVDEVCEGFGPQTPRDISSVAGTNTVTFAVAPPRQEMNLCNIHTHTQAEHKGPGFSISAGSGPDGGFQCNGTPDLTAAELAPAPGAYGNVAPGDTIEVHWVHTTCDAAPGEGLGACVPEGCEDPSLRVETQVFLVVNDENALDFTTMGAEGFQRNGVYQPKMIPASTGTPVTFAGSTTGPSYTQAVCSPAQVTWSVRPNCAKVDINSLHRWAADGNVFKEVKSHQVRDLVTDQRLLSAIQ